MASLPSGTAPSAPPTWRQFPFFESIPVKDVHDLDSPPDIFKATFEISTVFSSSVGVLIADIHGSVHALNRDFESYMSWVAHVGGRVTHMTERQGILVTLGEEDSVRSPLLKIWNLEERDKKTGAPQLLRSTKVQQSNRPHPATTVALSNKLDYLAIGLADGTVLLYRHLDQSLTSSTSLTAVPKAKTVHESPTEPVTGLGFREPTTEQPGHFLFVVTTNRVLAYPASGRSTGTVVDETGCGLGCATMDVHDRDIVIAREEAIYVCGTEGRNFSYAYEGPKSSIYRHLNYLVIVSPPFFPSAASASPTVRNFVARTENAGETDVAKINVFDPENKLVGYSGTFPQGAREVFSAWGSLFVLANDGILTRLQEKPTSEKLDMLYRKGFYLVALNLAASQHLEPAAVADIHRQYGEHLYAKGDYEGAVQQFVQTIGYVQPSYVVRRFLDAQRIHNLVTYLQELHARGRANADHTTLLLNAYTKLKDVSRLDSFIRTEARREADGNELPFDLETAIRVCRQAGYFEHASYLAKKYARHEDYLRIQIEDTEHYQDALAYIRQLGVESAESNLARYGRALLANLPEETTQLLIDLCTGVEDLAPTSAEQEEAPKPAAPSSYLSYLTLNRGIPSLESSARPATPPTKPAAPSIKTVAPSVKTAVPSIRTVTAPRREASSQDLSTPGTPQETTATSSDAASLIPETPAVKLISPRIYFAHFVDHMDQFVIFLETVALRRWGQSVAGDVTPDGQPPLNNRPSDKEDQMAVWNTLLELYLTLSESRPNPAGDAQPADVERRQDLQERALRILRSETLPYDPMHALILCSSRGYTDGLVLLWEKMGMYEDVLRFWMDRERRGATSSGQMPASSRVVQCLKQYGGAHPHLYPLVLRFLTSSPELLARHQEDVREILTRIDEQNIMLPLGVVQLLSRNDVSSVGMISEWLISKIRSARAEIQADKEMISSYRLETEQKQKLVDELSDSENPRIFHPVSRCSTCGGQLDLPTIHFMCSHSYHQRCLGDHENECPNCAREHGMIREIRRNNERLADQHDVFLSEVKDGGFDFIASAFSRGILNMPRVDEGVS
ncbi:hypothetical protein FISHEDRAFT_72138 [Fistulina hepatica ATCC 64428]|uniref:E3 ubiquitin-protein ligase PEP5 n=1 Tax=Fistulina hepatica ATCC 64428 TaxID=1128425 RepID=A0A0D7AF03_9AGAR|nr:hypothetical protein FISHEDRAFT_72138 [Fistulina hepatica ATCC 64428]